MVIGNNTDDWKTRLRKLIGGAYNPSNSMSGFGGFGFVTGGGDVDIDVSTIEIDDAYILTGEIKSTLCDVTLLDIFENPVAGKTVELSSSPAGLVFDPPTAVSDVDGFCEFTVTSSADNDYTITARDVTDSIDLSHTVEISSITLPNIFLLYHNVGGGLAQAAVYNPNLEDLTLSPDEFAEARHHLASVGGKAMFVVNPIGGDNECTLVTIGTDASTIATLDIPAIAFGNSRTAISVSRDASNFVVSGIGADTGSPDPLQSSFTTYDASLTELNFVSYTTGVSVEQQVSGAYNGDYNVSPIVTAAGHHTLCSDGVSRIAPVIPVTFSGSENCKNWGGSSVGSFMAATGLGTGTIAHIDTSFNIVTTLLSQFPISIKYKLDTDETFTYILEGNEHGAMIVRIISNEARVLQGVTVTPPTGKEVFSLAFSVS